MKQELHDKKEVKEAKAKLLQLFLSPSMNRDRKQTEKDVEFIVDVLMEK